MANSVQFSVDDTSPAIAYSPFADTFSFPNLSAGWNPYFLDSGFASSIGQVGVGQTQHITSRNGASVSVSWHGTSIQLFGNTTRANFSLTLDGASILANQTDPANSLLASLDGLLDANHTLRLTAITPEVQDPPDSSMLVFDKAVISSPPPANFSDIIFTDHGLQDDSIQFSGRWSFLPSSGPPPLYESQTQGDRAQVMFSGISVRIFGTTSPQAGNYSVILDGSQSPVLSGRSSFTNPNTLLFFATGLDPNTTHRIVILNQGGLLQLKSGGFDIFSSGEPTSLPPTPNVPGNATNTPSPPSSPSSSLNENFPRGTIAALVLAGVLAFILLTAILFFIFIWRPRQRRRRNQRELTFVPPRHKDTGPGGFHPKEQEAGAVLNIAPPPVDHDNNGHITISPDGINGIGVNGVTSTSAANYGRRDSGKSGFARWKREIDMISGLTALGIKFRHSDDVEGLGKFGEDHDHELSPRGVEHDYEGYSAEAAGVPHSSQSSSRSSRGKRKSGNNGGKNKLSRMTGFPFRFSSHSRQQAPGGQDDRGSLSGVTSLSYGSNPNLPAFLSAQPPSYAASVSHSNSNTNSNNSNVNNSPATASPPSVPRSVTRSPQSRSQSQLPSPQDTRGSSRTREASGGLILSYAGDANVPSLSSPEDETLPVTLPNVAPDQQQHQPQRPQRSGDPRSSESRPTGMHILGIGGALAGVGGPVSMRAAIRGLSPRISKSRSDRAREKAREKAREREREREHEQQERERELERQKERLREEEQERERQREERQKKRTTQRTVQRQLPPPPGGEPSSSDMRSKTANVGHPQQMGSSSAIADKAGSLLPVSVPLPTILASAPSPHPDSSGSGSGSSSPIRALPPIPTSKSLRSSFVPSPLPPLPQSSAPKQSSTQTAPTPRGQNDQPPARPTRSHQRQVGRDLDPPLDSPSFLSIRETSPFRLEFEQSSLTVPPGPSPGTSSSSSEKKRRSRLAPGDVVGLGSPGTASTVQSFAGAAGGIMVEGGNGVSGGGNGGNGGGDGEQVSSRRQSTASRVHFEDDPTSASNTTATTSEEPLYKEARPSVDTNDGGKSKSKGKGKSKEKPKKKFRLTPPSGQSPPTSHSIPGIMPAAAGMILPSDSSHSQSPPQAHGSETGQASFLDFSSQPPSLHSRHTSEGSTPWEHGQSLASNSGRVWSMQLPGRNIAPPPTGLKSKWSNTTIQSALSAQTASGSSSSPPLSGPGSPAQQSTSASQESPTSNIFPFPLSIPPSPYLPEGFPGVEPSPSMLSPATSIPAPKRTLEFGRHLHVPGAQATSGSGHRHEHDREHDNQEQGHDNHDQHEASHPGRGLSTETADSPTDSFPYSISEVHFRTSISDLGPRHEPDVDEDVDAGVDVDTDENTGQLQYVREHLYAHPPLPMVPLTPQRFNPSPGPNQSQQQQQPQPNTPTSIMQRVFGSGSGGGSTPRTPRSGSLKPPP